MVRECGCGVDDVMVCCSPSQVFQLLVDALKSKNKRACSEALEEMGEMLMKYGLTITKADKVLAD